MYRWILGLALSLTFTLAASPLWACSPPLQPASLLVSDTSGPSAIGIYYQRNDSQYTPDQLVATLSNSSTEVPGALSILEDHEGYQAFLAFTPEVALEVGTSYELRISVETDEEIGELGEPEEPFFEGAVTIAEASTPQMGELRSEWARNSSDTNCCSTDEGGCFDSCGSCITCWPTDYVYGPRLSADISAPRGHLVKRSLVVDGTSRYTAETFVSPARPAISSQIVTAEGFTNFSEACLEVEIISPDGQSTTSTKCLDREVWGEVPNEEVDVRDTIAQCAEEPNDTEDIHWQRFKAESEVSDDGGCSSTSGTPGFGLLLLGLLGLARIRGRS